ncbi:hypothetical protein [Streptococcus infantis]|uniref:hypothetical protein n=1 Tax=Streptococcus infantis TaxID=68892 RepID=UPI0039C04684
MNKEEWLTQFEEKYNRKPSPAEFIAAKKNNEFNVENSKDIKYNNVESSSISVDALDKKVLEKTDSENITVNEEYVQEHKKAIEEDKIFCVKCGKPNFRTSDYCVSCGSRVNNSSTMNSFISDVSEKFFIVSSKAGKKTKELTKSLQANTQIYTENKKREKLLLALGNAYYNSRENRLDDPFAELIEEIHKIDISIEQLRDFE